VERAVYMPIILDKVSHIYGEGTPMAVKALNNINLVIPDGQFIGLIGHTGSGKSTLVQHLNGLMKATEGNIYFNGEDIDSEGYNKKQLRSKVGLVFQYPEHQLFEMDVFTDVCFGPKNLGLSKTEVELRAYEALKLVGLEDDYFYQSPFELSGGQKRRVAIAGVLAMKPDVLILDEPTAGLDPKGRDEILDQIAKLKNETGITVILVSHSMDDVAKYVDRIIVMNKGSVMYDDVPHEIFKHYDELEKVGLSAPQVTYIMKDLKDHGYDVSTQATTIDEAKEEIKNYFARLAASNRKRRL
jgi:energy-coupling factor transport system ATP-binding protein